MEFFFLIFFVWYFRDTFFIKLNIGYFLDISCCLQRRYFIKLKSTFKVFNLDDLYKIFYNGWPQIFSNCCSHYPVLPAWNHRIMLNTHFWPTMSNTYSCHMLSRIFLSILTICINSGFFFMLLLWLEQCCSLRFSIIQWIYNVTVVMSIHCIE